MLTRLGSLALQLSRLAGLSLLCVACLALLGSGTCVYVSDDDDSRCYDDDASNDAGCDDQVESPAADAFLPPADEVDEQLARLPAVGGSTSSGVPAPWVLGGDGAAIAATLDPAVYRLHQPRIVESTDPRSHPHRRVLVAAGPSLTELWQLAVWSPVDLTLFAEQVRLANDDLLGLPPWAGELRHAGTFVLDTILAVVYEQVPPGAHEPLADARLVLVFDGLGRLLQVENEMAAPLALPTPQPESWLQR